MFIKDIGNELKLKKPLSVEVGISYVSTVKIGGNYFYGEGKTEEEAIGDLKIAIYDMYHYLSGDDDELLTEDGKVGKERFLFSFQ